MLNHVVFTREHDSYTHCLYLLKVRAIAQHERHGYALLAPRACAR